MVGRTPRPLWRDPIKAQVKQIKLIDKDIDHLNRIVVIDPILQTIREQRGLALIDAFDKSLHPISPIPT
jgi:hypothetical protein